MLRKSLISLITIIFIASCATPKAIDIIQVNDQAMTCNELRLAVETASLNEDIAHSNKGVQMKIYFQDYFFSRHILLLMEHQYMRNIMHLNGKIIF